jgi:hypothetical protein
MSVASRRQATRAKALRKIAPQLGVTVEWLETGRESPSSELARIILASDGQPLPAQARLLARQILEELSGLA